MELTLGKFIRFKKNSYIQINDDKEKIVLKARLENGPMF